MFPWLKKSGCRNILKQGAEIYLSRVQKYTSAGYRNILHLRLTVS